ncbi:unnamed protein product [Cyprideis torosa]|uniref:Uncharacterized protein n=1 Tax=Cyprideis torosa TaxID=163714 RepID=A0A7R8ZIV0_9CRUS|nr:unnamed protein product [Cyprideis torosa]CAG0887056.1 unnamed protein product [Cyprideis torosa]
MAAQVDVLHSEEEIFPSSQETFVATSEGNSSTATSGDLSPDRSSLAPSMDPPMRTPAANLMSEEPPSPPPGVTRRPRRSEGGSDSEDDVIPFRQRALRTMIQSDDEEDELNATKIEETEDQERSRTISPASSDTDKESTVHADRRPVDSDDELASFNEFQKAGSESEVEECSEMSTPRAEKPAKVGKLKGLKKKELEELRRESQKMSRNRSVSLPYHRPVQRTLDDFLKRKKLTVTSLKTKLKDLPELERQMKEADEEAEKFYRSESEDEEQDQSLTPGSALEGEEKAAESCNTGQTPRGPSEAVEDTHQDQTETPVEVTDGKPTVDQQEKLTLGEKGHHESDVVNPTSDVVNPTSDGMSPTPNGMNPTSDVVNPSSDDIDPASKDHPTKAVDAEIVREAEAFEKPADENTSSKSAEVEGPTVAKKYDRKKLPVEVRAALLFNEAPKLQVKVENDDDIIDLDEDEVPEASVPMGVGDLMSRFLKHNKAKVATAPKRKKVELSIVSKERHNDGTEQLVERKTEVMTEIGLGRKVEAEITPGQGHQTLRQALLQKIREKRQQKYENEEKEEEDEEDEAELTDEGEVEAEEATSEEESEEEGLEESYKDSVRQKSEFVDSEAEVSEDGNDQSDDEVEEVDDEEEGDGDAEEQETAKKNRIAIRPEDDSEEEEVLNLHLDEDEDEIPPLVNPPLENCERESESLFGDSDPYLAATQKVPEVADNSDANIRRRSIDDDMIRRFVRDDSFSELQRKNLEANSIDTQESDNDLFRNTESDHQIQGLSQLFNDPGDTGGLSQICSGQFASGVSPFSAASNLRSSNSTEGLTQLVDICSAKKKKGIIREEFVEQEAELSGSEEELKNQSSDEEVDSNDEEAIEGLMAEEYEELKLERDAAKVQRKVAQAHLEQEMEEDERRVLLIKEQLFEDGDLYSDNQRQRTFRWRNLNANITLEKRPSDDEGEAEDGNVTVGDEDASWRRERHEREKFLSESQQKELDLLHTESEDCQFLKLGQKVIRKLQSRDSNSEPFLERDCRSEEQLLPTQLIREKIIARRGSFLARGSQVLSKIAPKIKATATVDLEGTSNNASASTGRNFVFSAVEKVSVGVAKGKGPAKPPASVVLKRTSSVPGASPNAAKRIRMARNFDNLDENSKDGSLFKRPKNGCDLELFKVFPIPSNLVFNGPVQAFFSPKTFWYGEARSAPSSFHQREMIARDHNFLSPLSSQVNAEDFLKAAFQRMDKNLDGELTEEEMSMWVLGVGIQVASSLLSNNLMTFTRIDQGHDGLVSWPEYITYYLQTVKGIPLPPNVDPEEFLEKQERSIRGTKREPHHHHGKLRKSQLFFTEDPVLIRNIGVAAHIDAGKTTTTERMLYYAGRTSMLGNVDHGDTVTDFMEEERRRGITITSAAVSFPWLDNYCFNLIDTPGHVDFTMEVERCLRVLDGAVVVLDASAGVEAQTLTIWRQCNTYDVPRIIFLNKMDKKFANFDMCLQSIRERLHVKPLLVQMPVLSDDGKLRGVVDLVELEKILWTGEKRGTEFQKESLLEMGNLSADVLQARNKLVEGSADLDDPLAEVFLKSENVESISAADLKAALRRITVTRKAVPVLLGSALKNIGIQPLMDAVVWYLPNPLERKQAAVSFYEPDTLVAFAFKISHDEHMGVITFLRVYSGRIKTGDRLYNVNRECVVKVAKVFVPFANDFREVESVPSGNIAVVSGVKDVLTGDTICQSASVASIAAKRAGKSATEKDKGNAKGQLVGLETPNPVFFCSIEPPSLSSQKDLDFALERLQREDPSLMVKSDEDTGQTVLGGQGELHLEIIQNRIRNEYNVHAELGKLHVAYREAIERYGMERSINFQRHLGDRLQQVQMRLSIQKPENQPHEFLKLKINKESAENLAQVKPFQLVAIKRGLQASLNHGPILNYPLQNVHFGLHHLEVGRGTSELVVSSAASALALEMFQRSKPVLLEPVMEVVVTVEESYFSTILSDLTQRRGKIQEIKQVGPETKTVVVLAPLSELIGYSTTVRTLSSGLATVTMALKDFQKMSAREMKQTVEQELSEQRASWYEAVRDNPEALNIDEFLAFTHPEQSHSLLLRIVDDMFVALDVDGGETLDLGEFEVVKPEDVGMDAEKIKELFQMEDKRALFKMIDEDGDGKITKRELLQYLDPRNRARALLRARDLIQSIDDDKDGLVSMNELLAHQGPLMANPFFNLRAPANRVSGFYAMLSSVEYKPPIRKNKQTAVGRVKNFISDSLFNAKNLFGQLYKSSCPAQAISHWSPPAESQRPNVWMKWPFEEVVKQEFLPVKIGDAFGPTWATHWFKVELRIPDEWAESLDKKCEAHFRWNSNSEALLYSESGSVLQGLSFMNTGRNFYVLTEAEKKDASSRSITFFVEMACNEDFGAGGDKFLTPPNETRTYKLEKADLALFNQEAYKLLMDLEVLGDIGRLCQEDNPRTWEALFVANQMVNLIQGGEYSKRMDKARTRSLLWAIATLIPLGFGPLMKRFGNVREVGATHLLSWIDILSLLSSALSHPCFNGEHYADDLPSFSLQHEAPLCELLSFILGSVCVEDVAVNPVPGIREDRSTAAGAQQFAWVKEWYPELYLRIKQRIAEGRFIPVGGTWIEMDGNIPSGESFIRQFLHGQKFFEEEFNMRCQEFWLPDTFGYSPQIPQMIRHMGMRYFLTQKLSWSLVNKFPHNSFIWEGLDGTQVLSHFPPSNSYVDQIKIENIQELMKNLKDKGRVSTSVMLYGFGDGGGGPTADMIERSRRVEDVNGLPRLKLASPSEFWASMEEEQKNLCTWVGELYLELHNGTYTTQAEIKSLNRRCEVALREAEALISILMMRRKASDEKICHFRTQLDSLWKVVLLNQFHDILPGSSIERVNIRARDDLNDSLSQISNIITEAGTALCGGVDSKHGKQSVYFNSLPWPREVLVPQGLLSIPPFAFASEDQANPISPDDKEEFKVKGIPSRSGSQY